MFHQWDTICQKFCDVVKKLDGTNMEPKEMAQPWMCISQYTPHVNH